MSLPSTSIIIPTTCEASKRTTLERAIASVASQEDVNLELIVVVNGEKGDRDLYQELQSDPRICVHYEAEGHVAKARRAGAKASTGKYYGFLDDDDELLPMALKTRTDAMESNGEIDVLVTNGFIHLDGDELHVPHSFAEVVRKNAEMSLLQHNWFASPASLFRRSSVDPATLDVNHIYFEWTYLYFSLLADRRRIAYFDSVTYRKYEDNPTSVSKSVEYNLALPSFLLELKLLPLSSQALRIVNQKFVVALNNSAGLMLENGDLAAAIALHIKCLKAGGWRYLPFTRRLLAKMFGYSMPTGKQTDI